MHDAIFTFRKKAIFQVSLSYAVRTSKDVRSKTLTLIIDESLEGCRWMDINQIKSGYKKICREFGTLYHSKIFGQSGKNQSTNFDPLIMSTRKTVAENLSHWRIHYELEYK